MICVFLAVMVANHPPITPTSAAEIVTITTIIIHWPIVGSFLTLPVFALKSIDIAQPIVESKSPVDAENKIAVLKSLLRAAKKPTAPYTKNDIGANSV